MAGPVGFFDVTAAPLGWFDETAQPAGWFDRGFVGGGAAVGSVGLSEETVTAFALGGIGIRAAGLATSEETALSLSAVQSLSVGLVSEADSGFALPSVSIRGVQMALEIDASPGPVQFLAVETDTAIARWSAYPNPAFVMQGVIYGPPGAEYVGTFDGGGVGVGAVLYDLGSDIDYIVTTSRTIERL